MSVAIRGMGLPENREKSGALENAILIAGPTASGKSALALRVASAVGGVIVNADSMQVYCVLDRLTARPNAVDLAAAPHRLYGYVDPGADYSTGRWLRDVRTLIKAGEFDGRRAVFCGGTGLYFRALLEGLSAMPDIPDDVRVRWRARLAEDGPEELHGILLRDDPETAMRLQPADGQRIARALEVLEASGRSILAWQGRRGRPLVDQASATMVVLEPDRAELDQRIASRFSAMLDGGAVDEVRHLRSLDLDPAMPVMKAIGVREIGDYLDERATFAETLDKTRIATRQYAKRQSTWFRNQFGPEWLKISDINELSGKADAEIAGVFACKKRPGKFRSDGWN